MPIFGFFGPPDIEKLSAKRDVEGLVKALSYQKSLEVRQKAAVALGQIGDVRAVEPLIAELQDRHSDIRRVVAMALGQFGNARSTEILVAVLDENDSDISKTATRVLMRIGAPAVDPLISKLKNNYNAHSVEVLIAALNDNHARDSATEILVKIGASVVEPLIAALKSNSEGMRRAAAWALGEISDTRSVEPLIATLWDHEESIRRTAILALEKIGDSRGAEPIRIAKQRIAEEYERARRWEEKKKEEEEEHYPQPVRSSDANEQLGFIYGKSYDDVPGYDPKDPDGPWI